VTAGLAPPPAASPKPRWVPAYVALGSNLAEPVRQVERAFAALAALPGTRLMLRSSAYRSRPMGPVEQPDFVNAAAALLTQLDPATLLRAESGEADPELAQWWTDLQDASDEDRLAMVENRPVSEQGDATKSAASRRRRRPRRRRKPSGPAPTP